MWQENVIPCWTSCGNLLMLPCHGGLDVMDPRHLKVVHHFTGSPYLSWVELPMRIACQASKQEKTLAACERSDNNLFTSTLHGNQWQVQRVSVNLDVANIEHAQLAPSSSVLVGACYGSAGACGLCHFDPEAYALYQIGHDVSAEVGYAIKWAHFPKGMAATLSLSGLGKS